MNSDKSVGYYILYNNETKEVYVGSGDLTARKKYHSKHLRDNKHINPKLQEAFNQNPNFEFIAKPINFLETVQENKEVALTIEQLLILNLIDSPKCLNIVKNARASMAARSHTTETIQKMSNDKINKWADPEYRDKMSIALKEGWKKMTPEERKEFSDKVSNAQKQRYINGERAPTFGQTRSKEFKKNDSEKITELWKDPNFREKNLKAREGKNHIPLSTHKIEINGKVYSSLSVAGKEYNISKQTVAYRCDSKSDDFTEWKRTKLSEL